MEKHDITKVKSFGTVRDIFEVYLKKIGRIKKTDQFIDKEKPHLIVKMVSSPPSMWFFKASFDSKAILINLDWWREQKKTLLHVVAAKKLRKGGWYLPSFWVFSSIAQLSFIFKVLMHLFSCICLQKIHKYCELVQSKAWL